MEEEDVWDDPEHGSEAKTNPTIGFAAFNVRTDGMNSSRP